MKYKIINVGNPDEFIKNGHIKIHPWIPNGKYCIKKAPIENGFGEYISFPVEAIKQAEETAEEQEELYRLCPTSDMQFCDGRSDCTTLKNGKNKGCLKCAKEHRQLAEWLKDYKRLLEQQESVTSKEKTDVLDKIRAEIEKAASRYTISHEQRSAMGHVEWSDRLIKESEILEIIDKYREVNK